MVDRPRRGSDRPSGGRPGRGGSRFSREERPAPERPRLAPYPERPRPTFSELFRTPKPLIGVVHLRPLPGSPGYDGQFLDLLDAALSDARAIEAGGAAGLIVENFGDTPFYPDVVPPETVAAMTRLVTEIRKVVRIAVGVNVLRNDARAGVAVAAATGAGFVRVNVHTGVMVTDQGILAGRAYESLRLREALRSRTLIFADLRVKHARPLVDLDLVRDAEDTVLRGRADALIVTGPATGRPADLEQVKEIKRLFPNVRVLVGSGVDLNSIAAILDVADGVIVGTAIKEDGRIERAVDIERVRSLADVATRIAPRTFAERPPRPAFEPAEAEGVREPAREPRAERAPAERRPRDERGREEYPEAVDRRPAREAEPEAEAPMTEPAAVHRREPLPAAGAGISRPSDSDIIEEEFTIHQNDVVNGPEETTVQFGRGPVRKKRR